MIFVNSCLEELERAPNPGVWKTLRLYVKERMNMQILEALASQQSFLMGEHGYRAHWLSVPQQKSCANG